MDKVVACRNIDEILAPIHHIFAFDARDDLAAILHLSHDGARLRVAFAELVFMVVRKDGAMLGPMH